MKRDPALDRLLKPRLRIRDIAVMFGISKQTVWAWRRIPTERAKEIAEKTGIPLWELRPDLWDPPNKTD